MFNRANVSSITNYVFIITFDIEEKETYFVVRIYKEKNINIEILMIIEVYCTKNIFSYLEYFDTPVNLNHRIFIFNRLF